MKDKYDLSQQEPMDIIRKERGAVSQPIMTQLSTQQLDVDEATTASIMEQTNVIGADVNAEDMNQSNPLWTLPDEMMMYILSQVPPHDLLNARLMAKSKTAVVNATLELITRPHFIINYLSHADGIKGHQFTAFYQRTACYQELKRKVLTQELLTAEEAICYTLTRDCNVLPPNVKQAMDEITLDENTREHLELILTASEDINAGNAKLEKLSNYPLSLLNQHMMDYKQKLMTHVRQHHPHRFVNLLAGANLSGLQFRNEDFSYLNLCGVKLSYADLCQTKFRGAYLRGVDFNGALLREVDFTEAILKGIQLNRANLDEVDLSTIDLDGVDFEWAYIRNMKLLPKGALSSPAELQAVLSQFEQKIAKHSLGSKRKLEEQILKEIAEQIEAERELSLKEKIALLDMAMSLVKQEQLITGIFPFQNACQKLKGKLIPSQPQQDIPEHPLKKEAQKIIERTLKILDGEESKYPQLKIPKSIDASAYKKEYGLLMDCIAKYPELNDSSKIAEALGISLEMWQLLYITCPIIIFKPLTSPVIVYHEIQDDGENKEKHYASEVFNSYRFEIQNLQRIKLNDLDQYLYEEEDFVILEEDGQTDIRVKLGDLFITICPSGKAGISSSIEVIDFTKRERKPAFAVNLALYEGIPFEAFIPLNPYVNYGYAPAPSLVLSADNIKRMQEAYVLKRQIIERVFASEQINRNRKNDLFSPIFDQYEQEQSHLAMLPVELFDMVCTYVHDNTFKQRKNTSSLAKVTELHGLFFRRAQHASADIQGDIAERNILLL